MLAGYAVADDRLGSDSAVSVRMSPVGSTLSSGKFSVDRLGELRARNGSMNHSHPVGLSMMLGQI